MIHTIYSNSYEVLRTVLLNNIDSLRLRPESEELDAASLFANVFDRVPVIIPSRAVEADLSRAIATQESVCSCMKFMSLSEWLGFFSREPLANVIGNEARWMIWRLLKETGEGSLREEVKGKTDRLEDSLRNRSDRDLFLLAQRIAGVFVSYASYRLDWILEWLGLHQGRYAKSQRAQQEFNALNKDGDAVWQRALFLRLARAKNWRGRAFLECLPETLDSLSSASPELRALELGDGRSVDLPSALHIFMPFTVPPLMLPVLKAYAHSGREVWLYLLNPSSEYWFDLVPQRLFDWKRRESEAGMREVGHPILADNGRSVRANIDRLWRFTEESRSEEDASPLAEYPEDEEEAQALRAKRVDTHARRVIPENDYLAQYLSDPRELKADLAVESQGIYIEAREPKLLRRVQDSILKLEPDLRVCEAESGVPLFSEEDDTLRLHAAPSAVRELEGLVDWLHAQFREDSTLTPGDILVATPDISAAAPLIDQVFGSLSKDRSIAYRISGAFTTNEDAPLTVLTKLVGLLTGRFSAADFLSWLSLPLVAEKYRFEKDDLEVIGEWLASAGFDAGLSEKHLVQRAISEGLPEHEYGAMQELTLSRAIERLALGWATAESAKPTPFGDLLPVVGTEEGGWTPTSERTDLLLKLSTILADLENMRESAVRPFEPGESAGRRWQAWVSQAIELFFPRETPEQDWLALRSAVDEIAREIETAEDGSPMQVSLEIFASAIDDKLTRGTSAGRPGSAVSFTGMTHLRGLPYKIIVVWGLNADSRFPGSSRAEEFDLMSRFPRRGDRDSRLDNRNIFLDLLLAARRKFLVSYSEGFNPAERQEPSVVAAELRDWLLTFADGEEGRLDRLAAEKILTKHLPLNNFSSAAFLPSAGSLQSTDAELLKAVELAQKLERRGAIPKWLSVKTAPEPFERLPLDVLIRWTKDPAKEFLKLQEIRIDTVQQKRSVSVMPVDGGLENWQRRHELLQSATKDGDADGSEVFDRWTRNPNLGAVGVREWAYEKDLEFIQKLDANFIECAQGKKRLPATEFFCRVPGFDWLITHTTNDLWRTDEGEEFFIFASVGTCTGSEAQRAFFEWLLLCATRAPVGGALVARKPPKNSFDKTLEAVTYPMVPVDSHEAMSILGLVLRAFESATQGIPLFAAKPWESDARSNAVNRIVWRGLDLDAALDRGSSIKTAIGNFFSQPGTALEELKALLSFDEETSLHAEGVNND